MVYLPCMNVNCHIHTDKTKRVKKKQKRVFLYLTNYCSYAWPASVIKLFPVNVLPSWLRNADQWKPHYLVVTECYYMYMCSHTMFMT